MPITEPIDEDELEADLAALEQENLDEKMLKTGTVPQDTLNRMPKVTNGESECSSCFVSSMFVEWNGLLTQCEQSKGRRKLQRKTMRKRN